MTTTMRLVGCRASTSTWRIVAVSSVGRGDERQQPRRAGQHLRRRERARSRRASSAGRARSPPAALERLDELLRAEAVPALGGHAPGGRVRVAEQTEALEARELAAHRRRGHAEAGAVSERARADGLPRRDVLLDDEAQDLPLPARELHHRAMVAAAPADPRRAGTSQAPKRRYCVSGKGGLVGNVAAGAT